MLLFALIQTSKIRFDQERARFGFFKLQWINCVFKSDEVSSNLIPDSRTVHTWR